MADPLGPVSPRFRYLRFWRLPQLPIILSAILAALGVPIFLRLPLWCDVTLYDVAARTILSGGVHYRDVFDTNTPGYVWCLTLIRAALGNADITVRAVDLGIFAGVVFLLDRLANLGGASRTARWWAIAGMLAFYLFSTESIHGQRDVWLALPLLSAVYIRLRRIDRPARIFWPAFAEGLLWGLATWIKPHAIPLALAVWLLTVRRLSGGSWRIAGRDLAGNLAAGIALGLAGIAYLVGSGTWPHIVDVMVNWNGHYTELIFEELPYRTPYALFWFPAWSLMLIPSLALVLLALTDGRVFSARWLPEGSRGPIGRLVSARWYDPAPSDPARFARAVLAGLYVAWAFEAFFFQRGFHYVHVPETLIMMAVWASHRLCLPAFILAWLASFGLMFRIADESPAVKNALRSAEFYDYTELEEEYRHALSRPGFADRWIRCFTAPTTGPDDARLKDALKQTRGYVSSTNWEELAEVEAYLRTQNVKDRELICWDDGIHPLYLRLEIKPGLRFMHIHSAEGIRRDAPKAIRDEVDTNPSVRFVVSDLEWLAYTDSERRDRPIPYRPGRSPDNLVPALSPQDEQQYPYNGPEAVFRSDGGRGRYIVFAVVK